MSKAADRGLALMGGIALLLPLLFVFSLVSPAPSLADMAPESALLVHVQPVSPGWEWCLSPPISVCQDVVRSTPQEGELEFLLCFMVGTLGSGDCLESLHTVLTWPSGWQLLEFEPSGEEPCGWIGSLAGTELDLWWWEPPPLGGWYSVVPVARLVMNVVGPGQLGFSGTSEVVLRSDCQGPTYVTHPVQVSAVAGLACGHGGRTCFFAGTYCVPVFHDPELVLHAPTGGVADSTTLFSFDLGVCYYEVYTNAPWCTAFIETDYPYSKLHVTADATGLPPATYETAIELYQPYFGVGRCLPVTFLVEGATATSGASWGRIKSLYR
jgi:hypothetical protein